jgi:hypothetical protein
MKYITAVVAKQSNPKCGTLKCSENETIQRYYGLLGVDSRLRSHSSPAERTADKFLGKDDANRRHTRGNNLTFNRYRTLQPSIKTSATARRRP